MPIYTIDDVNTLKSFLEDDEVRFSIGYKSMENEDGYYYIGQVKEFTDIFALKDFPLVYRRRVMDILNGLNDNPQFIHIDVIEKNLKKIVYFEITYQGPTVRILDFHEDNIRRLEKMNILDYFFKEFSVLVPTGFEDKTNYSNDEIFYQIKNPNY